VTLRRGAVVRFRCSRRIGEYKAAGNIAYDAVVCFRRKRKVSISDDSDRSSHGLARYKGYREERRKGCWTARDLARRVRKIVISDRLTPREISLFLVRGERQGFLLMEMEKI